MCGIFGFSATKNSRIKKDKLEKIAATLFRLSETRGKDASGLVIQNSKKISVFKGPYSASRLIDSNSYKKFLNHEFDEVFDKKQMLKDQVSIMGQSRMETNGSFLSNSNNQPIIKDNVVSIHNGIVVNTEDLWGKYKNLNRKYEVDTEIINSLFRSFLSKTRDLKSSIKKVLEEIEGSASLGIFLNDRNYLILTTNTGSLYYLNNQEENYFIFASERYILNSLINKQKLTNKKGASQIEQLKPNECLIVNLATLEKQKFSIKDKDSDIKFGKLKKSKIIIDFSPPIRLTKNFNLQNKFQETKNKIKNYYKRNLPVTKNLKRCKKCILPETMPFISFNENGICNYCQKYEKKKVLGIKNLEKLVAKYKKSGNKQNCIVCLSGGRDSSYTLHYVKKVLGLNPIAYSYDWGMLTDLGRRNQARMCAKLGVEHILVAADIQKKREYIKLNVNAWLKKPELGTIPLFMAGDKQYFYYVNQIKKNNDIKLVIMGENHLEQTHFKNGFAGIRQKGSMAYHVPLLEKIRLLFYYFIQYVKNPDYLNASFLDSLSAFFSYFLVPHDYLNIYDYIKWDEGLINRTLIKEYGWETSKESKSTWRIGDGTAAFYNYIYHTVAGFSEHDTFRSNQIREGIITKEKALKLIDIENKPRSESMKWYFDTINVDIEDAVKTINKIPKKYSDALRKKVLVLTSTFPRWKNDTTPPFVYELEKRLTKDFEIHILAPHYQGAKKEEVMDELHVHRFQYFWPASWQKLCDNSGILPNLKLNKLLYFQVPALICFELINTIKLVKKEKINFIHVHWIIPQGIVAYLIFRLYKIPYIVTCHGGDIYGLSGKPFILLKKIIVKNAKIITVVSAAIRKDIENKLKKDIPIEVIPMGVDSKLFSPKKKDEGLKKKYNITGPFLLFIGTLTEKKGVEYLIRAMPKIIDKFPKAKLLIIGSGTLDAQLKKLTKDLCLTKNIIFLGGISNQQLPKYYATADILVVPSIKTGLGDVEGIPVVLMEGLASGKAIVASRVGGIPEIITHNINGLLVPEKDTQSLTQSITDVLTNNQLKSSLEKEAKKSSRKYDLKIIAEKFTKVYKYILD